MAASYIFGGDTGETRESLERKREFARRLLEGSTSQMPNTVGEGIAALGMALSGRWGMNATNKAEAAKTKEASDAYAKNLPFWLQSSMGGASAPSGPSPSPSQPTRSSAPSMAPQQPPQGKEEFISMMMPAALEASERTGIDPRLIIAQAAQETGWGKSAPGNNYFGIKSHGQGGGQNLATHEYVDGKRVNVNANFRQYGSPTESALGYADFLLSNPRYQPMLNAEGLDAQLAALGQSGYATDPNYAQNVGSIARGIPLPPEMSGNQGQDAIGAVTAYQPGMVDDPAALGPARYAPGMAPQPSPQPAPTPQPPQPPFNPLMQRRDQLAQQTGSQQIAQADPNRGFLAAILAGGQRGQPSGGDFPPAPSPDGMDAMRGPQLPFDPAMLELANNPFLPEGQRAVLQSIIQQQMQAADPMRRLEMQKAQLELEQLRNPSPDPTDDMREYQYAVSQGYQGSFQDFMTENRRAGATTVNVGPSGIDYGDPGAGLVWQRDANNNIVLDERGAPIAIPFQGGPAYIDQEAAARARQNAGEQAAMYGDIVLQDIERARDLIENSPWYSPTTGAIGSILKDIGGTNAADLQELTKVVKANIGFDRLQAMREASPTGGALGQVTQQELNFLQSTLGSLEQTQSEEQLLQNLDRLNVIYTNIMEKASAYPNAGEFGFTAPPSGGGEAERPPDVPQELWDVMEPEERALWQ